MIIAIKTIDNRTYWPINSRFDTFPQFSNEQTGKQVLKYLKKAIWWQPKSFLPHHQMAIVYTAIQQWESALKANEQAIYFNPTNKLLYWQTGLIYEQVWLKSTDDSAHVLKMHDAWRIGNISIDWLLAQGQQAQIENDFEEALRWYRRAQTFDTSSKKIQFLIDFCQFANGSYVESKREGAIPEFYKVDGAAQLETEEFRWALTGKKLSNYPFENYLWTGVLWWDGDVATLVDVKEEGNYRIIVRVQDNPPAPILFQLLNNNEPFAAFQLSQGNHAWVELSTEHYLEQGVQLLGIRYINDVNEEGISRNLVTDWIRLEIIHKTS